MKALESNILKSRRSLWIIVGIVLLIFCNIPQLLADGLDVWFERHPKPLASGEGVAYGKGVYVMVGFGNILLSHDAIVWTRQSISGDDYLKVAFGAGCFVAVGYGGSIVRSTDGINWVQVLPKTGGLTSVTYGGGMFIAAGFGHYLTSPEGINWVSHDLGIASDMVRFVNGVYVAVGHANAILTSTNAISWDSHPLGGYQILDDVAFGNGVFVTVGSFGVILRSIDAMQWGRIDIGYTGFLYGLIYANGKFVAVGSEDNKTVVLTSLDGLNWMRQNTGPPESSNEGLMSITSANGNLVAVGFEGEVVASPDGEQWNRLSQGSREKLGGLAYGNGKYVVVGDYGTILSSVDGVNWSSEVSGVSNNLSDVVFGKGTWIAGGGQGTVLKSSDGQHWAAQSIDSKAWISALAYKDGLFVAAGGLTDQTAPITPKPIVGTIWSSSDAETWLPWKLNCFPTICHIGHLTSAIYSPERGAFFAVGWGGGATSVDGLHWDPLPVGDVFGIASGNGRLVAVGDDRIYIGASGDQWTISHPPTGYIFNSITFGGGTFLAIGGPTTTPLSTTLFRSMDGQSWSQIGAVQRQGLLRLASGNDSVFATGDSGAILQSPAVSSQLALRYPRFLSGGAFATVLESAPGAKVLLERSTDLRTWTKLLLKTNSIGTAEILDLGPPTGSIYRAKVTAE